MEATGRFSMSMSMAAMAAVAAAGHQLWPEPPTYELGDVLQATGSVDPMAAAAPEARRYALGKKPPRRLRAVHPAVLVPERTQSREAARRLAQAARAAERKALRAGGCRLNYVSE